jgi:hypothetical protein
MEQLGTVMSSPVLSKVGMIMLWKGLERMAVLNIKLDQMLLQGVQEFCASILYLVVLCQFLISDAHWDSFEKPRAHSRAQRGCFLDKSQK